MRSTRADGRAIRADAAGRCVRVGQLADVHTCWVSPDASWAMRGRTPMRRGRFFATTGRVPFCGERGGMDIRGATMP